MKNNYDFWKNWKDKTPIEKEAIKSVEKARDLIIKSIPEKELVAIYIKGSFARKEMKKGSDVDVVPIVTKNRYEGDIFEVNSFDVYPSIVVPLSLWELKHNKLNTKSDHQVDLRAKPDILLRKLSDCRLIYGTPLNPKEFKIRTNAQVLKDEIEVLKKGYIPYFEEGEIPFEPLLKEVFWLTEIELINSGKRFQSSFEGIKKAVENKSHIVHLAYKLRKKKTITKFDERAFVRLLMEYLKKC